MKLSTFVVGTLTAAVVFSLATIATAADKAGPHAATPAPAAPAVAKSPFSGTYIGAHIGYSQMTDESDFNGWSAGGLVGISVPMGNGLIAGLELDGSLSSAGFSAAGVDLDQDWSVSARGKLGFEIGNVMPYLTAGIAWTRISGRDSDGGTTGETPRLWIAGGGIDYAIPATNIIAGVALLHMWDDKFDDGLTTVRGSLSVKLN